MFAIYASGVDITEYVAYGSVKITEQLNNRADTLGFRVDKYNVPAGSLVEVWEGAYLIQEAQIGESTIKVDETFPFEEKFRPGDRIILGFKTSDAKAYTIDTVDHSTGEITLTESIIALYNVGEKVGRLIYSGITQKGPQEEIGKTEIFSQEISATDLSRLMAFKDVVDAFEDMYPREIFGRLIYKFVANTEQITLDDFELAWSEGGNALPMVQDNVDRISGNYSQATGVTMAGVSTWTRSVPSKDISSMDTVRLWFKIRENEGTHLQRLTYRVGNNSSNFYEWTTEIIGPNFEDIWNYDSFKIADATVQGNVDRTDIQWLQIEVETDSGITSAGLKFDVSLASLEGFTLKNVERGIKKYTKIVQYKKADVFIEEMAKLANFFWYVDAERDLHFFAADARPAPMAITDTSLNYGTLKIDADISQLKNRQTVRGAEAPEANLYTQEKIVDGVEDSWYLDYKPKDISVFTDTGGGYVEKTIGVENLVDETTVDYVFNFNEKTLRRASDSILPADAKIKFVYYPYKQIRVRYPNQESIDRLKLILGGDGIVDGSVINDPSLRTWQEVRDRAKAEVMTYRFAILSADFVSEQDGWRAGQIVRITDTARGIDEDFLIQKVTISSRVNERWRYQISAASTMFGIIEFFQLLLKKADKLSIDVSELADIIADLNSVVSIDDIWTFIKKDKVVTLGDRIEQWYDFIQERGEREDTNGLIGNLEHFSQWYARFTGGETGKADFDKSSNYNTESALRLEAVTGGSGKSVSAHTMVRMECRPSHEYTCQAWLEILSELENVGTGGGAKLEIEEHEFEQGGSPIATHEIFSEEIIKQDFNQKKITLTTSASTNFFLLRFSIYQAAGVASLGDVRIAETVADTEPNPAVLDFCELT